MTSKTLNAPSGQSSMHYQKSHRYQMHEQEMNPQKHHQSSGSASESPSSFEASLPSPLQKDLTSLDDFFVTVDQRVNHKVAIGMKRALRLIVEQFDAHMLAKLKLLVREEVDDRLREVSRARRNRSMSSTLKSERSYTKFNGVRRPPSHQMISRRTHSAQQDSLNADEEAYPQQDNQEALSQMSNKIQTSLERKQEGISEERFKTSNHDINVNILASQTSKTDIFGSNQGIKPIHHEKNNNKSAEMELQIGSTDVQKFQSIDFVSTNSHVQLKDCQIDKFEAKQIIKLEEEEEEEEDLIDDESSLVQSLSGGNSKFTTNNTPNFQKHLSEKSQNGQDQIQIERKLMTPTSISNQIPFCTKDRPIESPIKKKTQQKNVKKQINSGDNSIKSTQNVLENVKNQNKICDYVNSLIESSASVSEQPKKSENIPSNGLKQMNEPRDHKTNKKVAHQNSGALEGQMTASVASVSVARGKQEQIGVSGQIYKTNNQNQVANQNQVKQKINKQINIKPINNNYQHSSTIKKQKNTQKTDRESVKLSTNSIHLADQAQAISNNKRTVPAQSSINSQKNLTKLDARTKKEKGVLTFKMPQSDRIDPQESIQKKFKSDKNDETTIRDNQPKVAASKAPIVSLKKQNTQPSLKKETITEGQSANLTQSDPYCNKSQIQIRQMSENNGPKIIKNKTSPPNLNLSNQGKYPESTRDNLTIGRTTQRDNCNVPQKRLMRKTKSLSMSKRKSLKKSILKIQNLRFSHDMSADKLKPMHSSLRTKVQKYLKKNGMGCDQSVPVPCSIVLYDTKCKHKFSLSLPKDEMAEIYEKKDPIDTSLNQRWQTSCGFQHREVHCRRHCDRQGKHFFGLKVGEQVAEKRQERLKKLSEPQEEKGLAGFRQRMIANGNSSEGHYQGYVAKEHLDEAQIFMDQHKEEAHSNDKKKDRPESLKYKKHKRKQVKSTKNNNEVLQLKEVISLHDQQKLKEKEWEKQLLSSERRRKEREKIHEIHSRSMNELRESVTSLQNSCSQRKASLEMLRWRINSQDKQSNSVRSNQGEHEAIICSESNRIGVIKSHDILQYQNAVTLKNYATPSNHFKLESPATFNSINDSKKLMIKNSEGKILNSSASHIQKRLPESGTIAIIENNIREEDEYELKNGAETDYKEQRNERVKANIQGLDGSTNLNMSSGSLINQNPLVDNNNNLNCSADSLEPPTSCTNVFSMDLSVQVPLASLDMPLVILPVEAPTIGSVNQKPETLLLTTDNAPKVKMDDEQLSDEIKENLKIVQKNSTSSLDINNQQNCERSMQLSMSNSLSTIHQYQKPPYNPISSCSSQNIVQRKDQVQQTVSFPNVIKDTVAVKGQQNIQSNQTNKKRSSPLHSLCKKKSCQKKFKNLDRKDQQQLHLSKPSNRETMCAQCGLRIEYKTTLFSCTFCQDNFCKNCVSWLKAAQSSSDRERGSAGLRDSVTTGGRMSAMSKRSAKNQ